MAGPRKNEISIKAKKMASALISGLEVEEVTGLEPGQLPDNIMQTIEEFLQAFADRYDIDLKDCAGLQWRSACMYVGEYFKLSGVTRDRVAERERGGMLYDDERLLKIVEIWAYYCGVFHHVPLIYDFACFAGISYEAMEAYDDRGILRNPSRLRLRKRIEEIQQSGVSAHLTDGKVNPVGTIFYAKARMGWRESMEVIHTEAKEISGDEIGSRLPE